MMLSVLLRVTLTIFVLSLCGGLTACGDAGPATDAAQRSPQTGPNAADEYRTLRAAMDPQLRSALSDSAGNMTPQLERLLPGAQPIIDRLIWATRLERCDWQIDYSGGLGTELPHLSDMRDLTRLLRAHGQRAARDGDMDAAAETTAAILRMSHHIGGIVTIEAIMAFAVLQTATQLINDHAGSWSASHRALILAELRTINRDDPFGGEAMLKTEERLARQSGWPPPDEQWFRRSQRDVQSGLQTAIDHLR